MHNVDILTDKNTEKSIHFRRKFWYMERGNGTKRKDHGVLESIDLCKQAVERKWKFSGQSNGSVNLYR